MNQIRKKLTSTFFLVTTVLVFTGFCGSQAIAQNQFQVTQPDSSQWTPPNTQWQNHGVQQSSYAPQGFQASNNTASESNNIGRASFPESALPFDSGVRTADFESPTDSGGSLEANIDSAAEKLSEWKDIAGEKASTWFGGLSSEGSWLEDLKGFYSDSGTSKVIGSLALVLGLYFLFVWVMRKINPMGNGGLPSEVVEVLGQVPFGAKRSLQMVRLGPKLLLLLNSPEGTQSIGEITDPDEVDYLSSLCMGKSASRSKPSSSRSSRSQTDQAASPPSPTRVQPRTVGSTSLNDVIQILQQANNPNGQTMFEA